MLQTQVQASIPNVLDSSCPVLPSSLSRSSTCGHQFSGSSPLPPPPTTRDTISAVCPGSASGSPLRWACLITQWAGAATLFWAYFNQCQPSHPGEKAHDDEGQNQDRPISIITGPALVQSWFNLWTNGEPLLFPQLFRSHIITSLYTLFL